MAPLPISQKRWGWIIQDLPWDPISAISTTMAGWICTWVRAIRTYTSLVPNRMYRNIEGQKFADVTNSARVGNLQKGHGVGIGDHWIMTAIRISISKTGGAFTGDAYCILPCFINPGQNDNNWIILSLLLEGVNSNRSAIGARIAVGILPRTEKKSRLPGCQFRWEL